MRVVGAVGAVVVVGLAAWFLTGGRTAQYATATVVRGPITQEVLASGNVESPTTSKLYFKAPGKMVALNVATGMHVSAGAVLAKQDTSVLDAQVSQAQAAVAAAKAQLAKLEAGATPETVSVAQAALASANQSLQNAYDTVPTTLQDAYAKANDAVVNELARFFGSASTANPTLTFTLTDATLSNRILAERVAAGTALAALAQTAGAPSSSSAPTYDERLAHADANLAAVRTLLTDAVAAVAANAGLSTTDAAAYRAAASAGLTETNAAIAEVEALSQAIATAKAAVNSAQASLALTTAGATSEDVSAAQAAVAQAQAAVDALKAQVRDLEIVAPFSGTVTDTNGTVGEVLPATTAVVSLMPDAALDVKVNVSEDNIVGVAQGDHARIELDAFPSGTEFDGTVSEIDPAETLIGGAVYYQTTLLFAREYPGIRPGMTANVWITTASSSDALIVPASALASLSASTTVRVLYDDAVSMRSVTTGIRDEQGRVQVLSGLRAGDVVITGP